MVTLKSSDWSNAAKKLHCAKTKRFEIKFSLIKDTRSYLFISGSTSASLSSIPSVMYLILVSGDVMSSNRMEYPTWEKDTHIPPYNLQSIDLIQAHIHNQPKNETKAYLLTVWLEAYIHIENEKGFTLQRKETIASERCASVMRFCYVVNYT